MTAIKTWNATGLTSGSLCLASIKIALLGDNDRAFSVESDVLYYYYFDATGTDAESSPDVIRPDDFATVGAGVWRNATSPIDSSDFGEEVGTIKTFAMDTPPDGYFECDGSAILRATYPDLFTAIGELYGVGDGSTTFNLPDYRGEFLRGYDHGKGSDPNAATRTDAGDGSTTGDNVGTRQTSTFTSHTHTTEAARTSGWTVIDSGANAYREPYGGPTEPTGSSGGSETRPRNVNVFYCIKY